MPTMVFVDVYSGPIHPEIVMFGTDQIIRGHRYRLHTGTLLSVAEIETVVVIACPKGESGRQLVSVVRTPAVRNQVVERIRG